MPASDSRQSAPIVTSQNTNSDTCTATTDPNAPAGSKNSLGAKSDCNGRPTTDDSVVEAMDEEGPLKTPATTDKR